MYTVQSGDTLFGIANQIGTNVPALIQANALYPPITDPNLIFPGWKLVARVPGMSQESALLYQVAPGDTLYRISQMFSVSAERLAELNRIPDPNDLHVAQLLYIPAIVYEVGPSDTLYRIAGQFGITLDQLLRANSHRPGLSPDLIYIGFRLAVPQPQKMPMGG
jgi:LysM repeat protein